MEEFGYRSRRFGPPLCCDADLLLEDPEMAERVIKNAIQCAYCGAEIESTASWDYKTHTCDGLRSARGPDGLIGVDGGLEPNRRRVGDPADWRDVSIYE